MRHHIRAAVLAVLGVSVALGGCARHKERVVVASPAPPPLYVPPAPVAPPIPGDPVWNLRAGLNVAALSCRGQDRRPVEADYALLLTRHRTLLAAVYRQEQARQSTADFDRQQTRIYNGFANQASPAQFCNAAALVAQRANALDAAGLTVAAPQLLGQLRAALTIPSLASR